MERFDCILNSRWQCLIRWHLTFRCRCTLTCQIIGRQPFLQAHSWLVQLMILLECGTSKKVRTGVQQDQFNGSFTNVKTDKYQRFLMVTQMCLCLTPSGVSIASSKGHQTEPHVHRGKKKKLLKFFSHGYHGLQHCLYARTHEGVVQDGRPSGWHNNRMTETCTLC